MNKDKPMLGGVESSIEQVAQASKQEKDNHLSMEYWESAYDNKADASSEKIKNELISFAKAADDQYQKLKSSREETRRQVREVQTQLKALGGSTDAELQFKTLRLQEGELLQELDKKTEELKSFSDAVVFAAGIASGEPLTEVSVSSEEAYHTEVGDIEWTSLSYDRDPALVEQKMDEIVAENLDKIKQSVE